MKYKCKQLMDVIDYSETMLKDAEAGNWRNVFNIEAERSKVLKDLFTIPFTKEDKNEYNQHILQVLVINKKLESITAQARDHIRNEAGAVNKGRRAVGVYAQNTG